MKSASVQLGNINVADFFFFFNSKKCVPFSRTPFQILAAIFLMSQSVRYISQRHLEACPNNSTMLGLAHCSLLALILLPKAALSLCPGLTGSGILGSHFACTMSSSEHRQTDGHRCVPL